MAAEKRWQTFKGKGGSDRSKRRMKDPMAIEQVLNLALKQAGISDEIARYQFVLRWEEIVGEKIASKTRPECISHGRLVVRVTDSVWAQELSFQKAVIIQRLQKYLAKDQHVTDVIFYVAGQRGLNG